jgi:hypothetical protein
MVAVCEKTEERVSKPHVPHVPAPEFDQGGDAPTPSVHGNRPLLTAAAAAIEGALSKNPREFLRLHRQLEGE